MSASSDTQLPRAFVVARLREDLIGPRADEEVLSSRPSDVWLTGILWPPNEELAPEEDERLAVAGDTDTAGDDTDDQARPLAVPMRRPSTAGLSFAAHSPGQNAVVDVVVTLGLYSPVLQEGKGTKPLWKRKQIRIIRKDIALGGSPYTLQLNDPDAPGLRLHVRSAAFSGGWLATLTLVNRSALPERSRENTEQATFFQVGMEITPATGTRLIARPSRRALVDEDDFSAALLYQNAREYAAGHTCSADWSLEGGEVSAIRIAWLPQAETPATSAEGHAVFKEMSAQAPDPLAAGWLATAGTKDIGAALTRLCEAYEKWINLRRNDVSGLPGNLQKTGTAHIDEADRVLRRMKNGVQRILNNPDIAAAFRLANLAMETQSQWKEKDPGPLLWRPFQLGFLLLSLESALDGSHPDRDVMDLLWFPTGGGKTEAYLGLIALVAFHRRLSRRSPDDGAGVAVIMRYTLRLLTAQQFVRATAMITACEAIRRGKVKSSDAGKLGSVPFSVGLWVGGDATPNKRAQAFASIKDNTLASPEQLLECPHCHSKLRYRQASGNDPVTVWCDTATCLMTGPNLPVWTVDEDIYDAQPTLVIGTVDKFAQIVRSERTASLFGVGTTAQPQLILQDELHLIAGPLGTLAGLYETALDLILSTGGSKPKIIGSTATIRRASDQVRALFDRQTCQFPPPGLDASDSGFAVIDRKRPGRLYIGLTTAGRSAKFALQAAAASLLQTATALPQDIRDPYWTLVTYFNSLRELGGALVLVQDDVNDTLKQLMTARNEAPRVPGLIEELTSRRSQLEIRDILKKLEVPSDKGAIDIVLATNMLSVGVDIPRLGLMLVNGQPKTMAEYIQSTSRVGRGKVDGLVVASLNAAKPRDRSHYETFRTWHATLYRDVEATSVTPFASRARDRALHAVLVAVIRHTIHEVSTHPHLTDALRPQAEAIIDRITKRAAGIDRLETDVRSELTSRLDAWFRMAPDDYWRKYSKRSLMQAAEEAAAKRAAGHLPGHAWPTPNSLRSVEPVTPFRLAEVLRRARQHA